MTIYNFIYYYRGDIDPFGLGAGDLSPFGLVLLLLMYIYIGILLGVLEE